LSYVLALLVFALEFCLPTIFDYGYYLQFFHLVRREGRKVVVGGDDDGDDDDDDNYFNNYL
jgi:hypothetical protein